MYTPLDPTDETLMVHCANSAITHHLATDATSPVEEFMSMFYFSISPSNLTTNVAGWIESADVDTQLDFGMEDEFKEAVFDVFLIGLMTKLEHTRGLSVDALGGLSSTVWIPNSMKSMLEQYGDFVVEGRNVDCKVYALDLVIWKLLDVFVHSRGLPLQDRLDILQRSWLPDSPHDVRSKHLVAASLSITIASELDVLVGVNDLLPYVLTCRFPRWDEISDLYREKGMTNLCFPFFSPFSDELQFLQLFDSQEAEEVCERAQLEWFGPELNHLRFYGPIQNRSIDSLVNWGAIAEIERRMECTPHSTHKKTSGSSGQVNIWQETPEDLSVLTKYPVPKDEIDDLLTYPPSGRSDTLTFKFAYSSEFDMRDVRRAVTGLDWKE
jgi:hypothetical protein